MTRSTRNARKGLIAVGAVVSLTATFAACGNPTSGGGEGGDGDVVTLRLADSFPPSHTTTVEGAEFFMERAEELSDGTLKFEHYPAEQLAAAPDLLDAAKDGVSDISYVGMAYVGDTMPLSDVGSLPGSFESAVHGTEAYWQVVEEYLLEAEYLEQGVRPLWAAMNPPYNISTTDTAMDSLDDVKGLQLRASGGTLSRTIQSLGANPVEIAAPEIYQALQRGTIDGNVGPISSLPDYELEEVLQYGTTNASLGSFVQAYVINDGVWETLTPEQQEALTQAGQDTMDHLPGVLDDEVDKTIDSFNEQGLEFGPLPDEVAEEFNSRARDIWDAWAKDFDERGLEGTKVVELWEQALQDNAS